MARLIGTLAALAAVVSLAGCGSTAATTPPVTSSTPTTRPKPITVVGLGDSVMSGFHCKCPGIVAEYDAALGRRTGRRVSGTNLGGNGLVTNDVLSDLRTDRRTRAVVADASVVLLTIGANDLGPQLHQWQSSTCPASCYEPAAAKMGRRLSLVLDEVRRLRHTRQPEVRPDTILVTNYWNVFTDGDLATLRAGRAQVQWSDRVTDAANTAICRAAHRAQARCVDLVRPFKGNGDGDPTALLAPDADHPDAAGVQVIVKALLGATPELS